jgi:hypothetical protein
MITLYRVGPVLVTFTVDPVQIFFQIFQRRAFDHNTPLTPTNSTKYSGQSETYNDRNQYGSSVAPEKSRQRAFHSIHCVTQKNVSSLGYVDTVHSFIICRIPQYVVVQ